MLTNKELEKIIDESIKAIWVGKIEADYSSGWLLKEDTLKNALYFHLRTSLETIFDANDLRIFTEFTDGTFKGSQCRPDMVIAKVNMDYDGCYWGNAVTDCLAVIEIKFKSQFTSSREVQADYEKLRHYAQVLGVNCKMYMATIWECEDDESTWIRKNAAWAKGRVTELNASLERNGEARFYVFEHK